MSPEFCETIDEYAPGWTRGISHAKTLQSGFQALSLTLDSLGFIDIMQSASLRGAPMWKTQVAIGVHATGMITKILGTAGGFAMGAGDSGSMTGAVSGAILFGAAVSVTVDRIEAIIFRKLGVK